MPKLNKKSKNHQPTKAYYEREWASKEARQRSRLMHHLQKLRIEKPRFWWAERKGWQKALIGLLTVILVSIGMMYGIARVYIASQANNQLQLGTTFIPSYAESYGLNAQDTLHALMYDMGMRHFRLVSYWSQTEPAPGVYDFSELDWQFKMAEASGAKISLALGLRQPRWPECHMPLWAVNQPESVWAPQLQTQIGKVIERYKNSPALQSYQLENEFFLKGFGECYNFNRQRLVNEYNFVKKADPNHPVIVTRSNNALGVPVGQPTPDVLGVSIYKRVWDKTITHRYFEYPFPAWFYAFLAGADWLATGKDTIVHELQAEPWLPPGYHMNDPNTVAEQNKSMDAKRLKDRIQYGRATGMKTIDLWGAEWWYYRKVKLHDPSLWDTVKAEIQDTQNTNLYKL